MSYVDIAKAVTNILVGAGTYSITRTIISAHVEPDTKLKKVTVNTGSIVLASMVADASTSYTDAKIDAIVAWWNKLTADSAE